METINNEHIAHIKDPTKAPKPASERIARRVFIIKTIKRIGVGNIPIPEIARRFSCSELTIYNDIKKIKKEWSKEDIEDTQLRLSTALIAAINDAHTALAQANTSKDRAIARKDIALLSNEFTKFLESYGYKERVLTAVPTINVSQLQQTRTNEYKIVYEQSDNIHSTAIPDGVPEKQGEIQVHISGEKVGEDTISINSNNTGNSGSQ